MEKTDWLIGLDEKIFNFSLRMSDENFTHFKYSLSGDLYSDEIKWGLGQAVFFTKILYMLNKFDKVGHIKLENISKFIKSFQKPNGYIYDSLISKLTRFSNFKQFLRTRDFIILSNKLTKRAETRQSLTALLCLNSKPQKPFLDIPYTRDGINKYLSSLDWKEPWAAGSHFSHLLFFYNFNKTMFKPDFTESLIDFAITWINKLQSKDDGTWHYGDIPMFQKINGAMKVLTGFSAVNFYDLPFVEKLIDTVLLTNDNNHACHNFNSVYCLYFASKLSNHRKNEVEEFCLHMLDIYKEFYREKEGGFSFYKSGANDIYYGARITKGLNEPDIHGTVMYLWGITLISKILKINGLNFSQLPIM